MCKVDLHCRAVAHGKREKDQTMRFPVARFTKQARSSGEVLSVLFLRFDLILRPLEAMESLLRQVVLILGLLATCARMWSFVPLSAPRPRYQVPSRRLVSTNVAQDFLGEDGEVETATSRFSNVTRGFLEELESSISTFPNVTRGFLEELEAAISTFPNVTRGFLGELEAAISHLPAVPSGLSCRKWDHAPWLTFGLLVLPIAAVAAVVAWVFVQLLMFICLGILACASLVPLEDLEDLDLEVFENLPLAAQIAAAVGWCVVVASAAAGGWASWLVAARNPIPVPHNWRDCTLQFVTQPDHIFPWHAGSRLPGAEQELRLKYYTLMMLWLILFSYVFAQTLTMFGQAVRACRVYAARQREVQGQYTHSPLVSDDTQTTNWCCAVAYQVALNMFCAALSYVAAATGRLDGPHGLCWEVYLLWVSSLLVCSLLQAIVLLVQHSGEEMPSLGFATVEAVLPVLGEPLDLFKDWLFVALAVSSRSWSGCVLAALAALVLIVSGTYLQAFHPTDLIKQLAPVQGAWLPKRGLLDAQTSPAKLAVAMSEDLPQAGPLHSIFYRVVKHDLEL